MRYKAPTKFAEHIHSSKYRGVGESFHEYVNRVSGKLADGQDHFHRLQAILGEQRFLPAGRVQSAIGSAREVTAINCFVSQTIEDSFDGIMRAATAAGQTMRAGGGIGYNFGTIRPRGSHIKSMDTQASGPVSFMQIFDSICQTVASAGARRGAQMGVMPVHHPDILEFVRAKRNNDNLTGFNVSVGVTDAFMDAVKRGTTFPLHFKGDVHSHIDARDLWDEIMRSTWDWAEPGILFLDRINKANNLQWQEHIQATNPCGEQPLPPNGACLLGSVNLTRYCKDGELDLGELLIQDLEDIVRAMDNVVDVSLYPLAAQKAEEQAKRRMGIGVTGLANALEYCGHEYGSPSFLKTMDYVLESIMNECYTASARLAKEKGTYPAFDLDELRSGETWQKLHPSVKQLIERHGLRNSHLTSIAPTGTISLAAGNVSGGIEPPFMHEYQRDVKWFDHTETVLVQDYALAKWGIRGVTAEELSGSEHVNVLARAQQWIDSAVSKTCNVGKGTSWEEFKGLYTQAYDLGCKGVTTFRPEGKRFGVLRAVEDPPDDGKAEACFIDPETGMKECA